MVRLGIVLGYVVVVAILVAAAAAGGSGEKPGFALAFGIVSLAFGYVFLRVAPRQAEAVAPQDKSKRQSPLDDCVGVLKDGAELWGYLRARPSYVTRVRWPWRKVVAVKPAVDLEMYRVNPPKPDDIDWADELGLSDTVVTGDEVEPEMARLRAGEFLLLGRTLEIAWLEGDEAEQIRQRFFSASRW